MIRPVNETDFEDIMNILNYYIKHTTVIFDIEPYTLETITLKIMGVTKKHMWIVYIDDETNDLLGFAYASTFYPKQGYDKNGRKSCLHIEKWLATKVAKVCSKSNLSFFWS